VLRLIGEELRKDRTARVIAQVPVAVATYLINEKREWLRTLEDKSEAELIVVPNENIQTPEYSIRRVRHDEMDLPEHRQATYLMPAAPEITEPGIAQDKKPPSEAPAVTALLPATAAPSGAPSVAPAATAAADPAHAQARVGFWSRFKRLLAGEPVAAEPPQPQSAGLPARPPRRDGGPRRDGRGEHPRHSRYADGARRERSDGRGGDGRDRNRNRDGRDRDRSRDQGRRPERFAERGAERGADRGAPPDASARPDSGAAAPSPAPPGEARADRPERTDRPGGGGRGRRGRRRGRRGGGGGAREGGIGPAAGVPGAPEREPEREAMRTVASPESNTSSNGSPDAPAPVREPREQPPVREFHAEPVEPAARHEPATIAHFEPTPKPDSNTPYVVWTSAPPEKGGGDRGPEE
jgi:ribonuclease E